MAKFKKDYSESISALGLSQGATLSEIREAYRKLAKLYHPDVYKLDDGERFKEISSAYRFLKKHPEAPVHSTQQKRHYSTQNKSARSRSEYYRRKRFAQARKKQEMYLWMFKKLKPFVLLVLVFNILLTLDYLLPALKEKKEIINYSMHGTRKSVVDFKIRYEYTILFDDNQRRSFEVAKKHVVNRGDNYTLAQSLLFGTSIKLVHHETHEELTPIYSVYKIFGCIIPFVFILQYLYFYRVKNNDLRLGLVAFMIIAILMQISLTFFNS